jgi:hypothetical protein
MVPHRLAQALDRHTRLPWMPHPVAVAGEVPNDHGLGQSDFLCAYAVRCGRTQTSLLSKKDQWNPSFSLVLQVSVRKVTLEKKPRVSELSRIASCKQVALFPLDTVVALTRVRIQEHFPRKQLRRESLGAYPPPCRRYRTVVEDCTIDRKKEQKNCVSKAIDFFT